MNLFKSIARYILDEELKDLEKSLNIKNNGSYKEISHYGDVWFSFNEEFSWGNHKIQ